MTARSFRDTLKSNDFIITAEVGQTKGADTTKIIEYIGLLRDKVHALNATDNKSSVMRYPAIGSCLLIREMGGEAVMDVTCRDRNRLAIQADLLFAWSRGISNVLCLTGDAIEYGDDRQAKPVFDVDCLQLIRLVQSLNSGKDMGSNELTGATNFCIGITALPRAESNGSHQASLTKKLEIGVDFVVTQAAYDVDDLKKLVSEVRAIDRKVKVLAGIMPLVSVGMGRYINSNMPGIHVPDNVLSEMSQAPAGKAILSGINIAARMIKQLKNEKICDGVHIMFPGREERIPDVIEAAGLS
jgi:methylenetetrahydrofolate reductase (NADPH)